eukprot:TRINITY_DN8922_c0_g1_i1.p1 TRINITY_DN8922_c0_g1~~TRINITY_DN8922_c0_g1_i1.p1  ORF type:complete len:219 (+),score=80.02 TRINITY_DN8922_c0_g1_i1:66-722(+)
MFYNMKIIYFVFFFFFFKQKTAYEMLRSLVGSEMCIRDSDNTMLRAVALATLVALISGTDPIVCPTVLTSSPLCQICIDEKWTQAACQGINQNKCRTTYKDAESCAGDHGCGWDGEHNKCNDVNVVNCPMSTYGLQGCIDYDTEKWMSSDPDCQAKQKNCEQMGAPTPPTPYSALIPCLLYTSDAADEEDSVDLGGRRIIKKKKEEEGADGTDEDARR